MTAPKKWSHQGRSIARMMLTSVPPDRVWAAWTDPARISQWFTDGAEGQVKSGSEFTWIFERFNYRFPFQVLEADPPNRFVLCSAIPDRGERILDVTIKKEGGQTKVLLVNSGFLEGAEWEEEYDGVVSGWEMSLALLKEYLEHYFGQSKATFLAMIPANFEYAKLAPFYRSAEKLSQWLTKPPPRGPAKYFDKSQGIIASGSKYLLALRSGAVASGRVLAVTRWEVALAWEEIRGTMELKGFSMGPGNRFLCVRGYGYGMKPEHAQEIEREMLTALERLKNVLAKRES